MDVVHWGNLNAFLQVMWRPPHKNNSIHKSTFQSTISCMKEVSWRQWCFHDPMLSGNSVNMFCCAIVVQKKQSYVPFVLQNVGKALRSTWKCLMLGLYNFALCYSTPATVAATFVPDFSPARNRTWMSLLVIQLIQWNLTLRVLSMLISVSLSMVFHL